MFEQRICLPVRHQYLQSSAVAAQWNGDFRHGEPARAPVAMVYEAGHRNFRLGLGAAEGHLPVLSRTRAEPALFPANGLGRLRLFFEKSP